jgi:hypothetical protein
VIKDFRHHPWYILDRLAHHLPLPKRVQYWFCNRFEHWIAGDVDDWEEVPE